MQQWPTPSLSSAAGNGSVEVTRLLIIHMGQVHVDSTLEMIITRRHHSRGPLVKDIAPIVELLLSSRVLGSMPAPLRSTDKTGRTLA